MQNQKKKKRKTLSAVVLTVVSYIFVQITEALEEKIAKTTDQLKLVFLCTVECCLLSQVQVKKPSNLISFAYSL